MAILVCSLLYVCLFVGLMSTDRTGMAATIDQMEDSKRLEPLRLVVSLPLAEPVFAVLRRNSGFFARAGPLAGWFSLFIVVLTVALNGLIWAVGFVSLVSRIWPRVFQNDGEVVNGGAA